MSNISNEPVLNLEHLEVLTTLSDDDPKEFIVDLFRTFKDAWPEISERIKTSSASKDNEILRKAVHQLNGSAANIGLNRLCMLCRDIETKIHENAYSDHETCYTTVSTEYNNSISELQGFLDSL